jgi:glucose/mannose-6-phosphate isomerase
MYTVDKNGFKNYLINFYKQIEEAPQLLQNASVKIDATKIHNILYLGMGGSAISGDLLSDVLYDTLTVPLSVVRGYDTPAYCNKNTLIIAASYSGNTEETLSALNNASENGAQIVCITTGGELLQRAQKNNWSAIKIPGGIPPRQALGYIFFPLYHFLGKYGLVTNYKADLTNLVAFAKDLAKRNNYPEVTENVLSLKLAKTIQNKIPIFYSTTPYLRSVSKRWKNQIQENSKSMAFANILPEMNHNEIVGWEQNIDILSKFVVIFLENENTHPRILKRIELSKEIIKKSGAHVIDLYASGNSPCERVFSLLLLGDWVSYYLAMNYKKDPIHIKSIDYLKEELTK